MSDVEFADGLLVKPPHENAPDFVKANISIKRDDLIAWLQKRPEVWLNLDVKVSRAGRWYASLNNWKPKPKADDVKADDDDFADDIPF
jgi:hypothetical protein